MLAALGVLALLLGRFVYVGLTMKPGSDLPRIAEIRALVASAQGATEADFESERNGWRELESAVGAAQEIWERIAVENGGWRVLDDPIYGYPIDFDAVGKADVPAEVLAFTLAALKEQDEAGIPGRIEAALRRPLLLPPITVLPPDPSVGDTHPSVGDTPAVNRFHSGDGLADIRRLLGADRARFRLAVASADSDAVGRIIDRQGTFQRAMFEWPLLLHRLVAMSAAGMMCEDVRAAAIEGRLPTESLRRIADVLGELEAAAKTDLVIEVQRLITLGVADWCHTERRSGDGRLLLSRLRVVSYNGLEDELIDAIAKSGAGNIAGFLFPSKADAVAAVHVAHDGWVQRASKRLHERGPDVADPDAYVSGLPRGHVFIKSVFFPASAVLKGDDRFYTELAGTRAFLLLEAERLEHGQPPKSIDAIGVAAIDPMTGKRFGYILMPPDNTGRCGYILYAFGADLVDNGGEGGRKHLALTPPVRVECDWIISEPEPTAETAE